MVRTSESWPEFRIVGEFLVRYFESVKKYLVQKIRTRRSALYIRTIFCVKLSINNHIVGLVVYERVWFTTQLAKLSFNHSNGRTHSWRFSTFYEILLENLPGIYEYSYTRDRRTRYIAHHSSILWVRTTAVSIAACVQRRSLAETRPLYSRRPCRRKVLQSVRSYDNSQYTLHLLTLYAETLKHGRAANRRHYMRPWIYGSRVGT